ncbi:MAG: DUF2933 domain-containing protein [Pseudomonadales bacterium]
MEKSKFSFWWTPKGLAALGLIAIAAYVLITEHGAHLAPWLPFLILLLCPLMHIFMHGGHGGHESHHEKSDDSNQVKSGVDQAYIRGVEEGRRQAHRKGE